MSVIINSKSYTKLNLGCGDSLLTKFPEPWLNTDIETGVADYVCDIRNIPDEWVECFDEVRASHVLEHIFLNDWQPTIKKWVDSLSRGGIIRVIVPDLEIVIKCLLDRHDKKMRPAISGIQPTPVMAQIYGFGYENPNRDQRWLHRMIVDSKSLIEALSCNEELLNIEVYPQSDDPARILGIKDDSQNQFTLCVKATKR